MGWILFQSFVVGGVVCLIIYLNGGTNPYGYAPAVLGVVAAGLLTHLINELRGWRRRRKVLPLQPHQELQKHIPPRV